MAEKFKERLITHCMVQINEKLELLDDEIRNLAGDAANETKSSMGDKYETGRERMMQEIGKLQDQQLIQHAQLKTLEAVLSTSGKAHAGHGSLIRTDKLIYFIAVPLGMISFEEHTIAAISIKSPIGQALEGSLVGDKVSFNTQSFVVKEIQ